MGETKRPQKRNAQAKSSKRIRQEQEVDRKAQELTSLIFGSGDGGNASIDEPQPNEITKKHVTPQSLLSKSVTADAVREDASSDDESENDGEQPTSAAWEDNDNSMIQITGSSRDRLKKLRDTREETRWQQSELEQRLRQRYEKTAARTARTNWAAVDTKSASKPVEKEVDDQDFLEGSSGAVFAKNRNRISSGIIDMVRLKDANEQDPCGAVLRCVSFHPMSDPDEPLLMTAGLDKTIRFFQVGEEESKKIHGIHFPKLPIYKASFLPDSNTVVATGRRPFFYFYDMASGKVDFVPQILGREEKSWETHFVSQDGKSIAFLGNDGYIVLVDPHSKQSTGFFKLNGSVRSAAFTPGGTELLASGSDGIINRFDIGTRKCIERFSNNDGTVTSSLDASADHFAAGAESGVVNLYSTLGNTNTRKPIRSIMNVSTAVDCLRFNHDGQILAMSSRFSSDCLKLLHVPSRTVFSNWPTSKTPLNYVFAMDFSPKSRYLTVGNDKGKCLLYKLRNYHDV